MATFVWPLLGIHQLLVEEKGRLLDECSLRMEAAIAEGVLRQDLFYRLAVIRIELPPEGGTRRIVFEAAPEELLRAFGAVRVASPPVE